MNARISSNNQMNIWTTYFVSCSLINQNQTFLQTIEIILFSLWTMI